MLLSLLFKSDPEDVRLILVDPKMLELAVYDGIPHLLTPVITDMTDASNGLRWCVAEMDRRYKLMSMMGVRNLASFNKKIQDADKGGKQILNPLNEDEEEFLEVLPSIVVVVDEFADIVKDDRSVNTGNYTDALDVMYMISQIYSNDKK